MITARITGGLGNQLFQYATARAVARRAGRPLTLDLAYYAQPCVPAYQLDRYPIAGMPAPPRWVARVQRGLERRNAVRAVTLLMNVANLWPRRLFIRERSPRYDARLRSVRTPAYLSGYWQSERYFVEHAALIRRELTLPTEVPGHLRSFDFEIRSSVSVGVSVRRGDYLQIPNTQGICTPDYYRRAIAHVKERAGPVRLFVFSDDIPWCRSNLPWDPGVVFEPDGAAADPAEALRLLSRCRHFIVANSSFAWWGAWLGAAPDKIVVAPARWMQNAADLGDVVPPSWIPIEP